MRYSKWKLLLAGFGLTACASQPVLAQNTCQAKSRICQYGLCDGDGKSDPATVTDQKTLGQWDQSGRRIFLHLFPRHQMGWASIEHGAPGDRM